MLQTVCVHYQPQMEAYSLQNEINTWTNNILFHKLEHYFTTYFIFALLFLRLKGGRFGFAESISVDKVTANQKQAEAIDMSTLEGQKAAAYIRGSDSSDMDSSIVSSDEGGDDVVIMVSPEIWTVHFLSTCTLIVHIVSAFVQIMALIIKIIVSAFCLYCYR